MKVETDKIRMRKISRQALGAFRMEMSSLLAFSPDPFAFLEYNVDMTKCKILARRLSAEPGSRITLTHVLNKLLAVAVSQNPIFNQVMLGKDIYQLEDILVSNGYLVPGTESALAYVIIKNAHKMSLEEVRDALLCGQQQKTDEFLVPRSRVSDPVKRFIYRHNLIRFLSEKFIFRTALKKGIVSNIVFLNHIYQKPSTFKVIKPVITPLKVSLRIHAHGCEQRTVIERGQTVIKDVLPLHVAVDHRVMHGIHAHRFGESLDRIAADPEKYLL